MPDWWRMLVVRGTKKLRDRVRATPAGDSDVSTTLLGDWFATALFWKPQVALLVNERTLLPVYMPLAPAATLLDRVPEAIASALRLQGVDEATIASELAAMSDTRIAPTNNPSIIGVMNGFAMQGTRRFGVTRFDLEQLTMEMSRMITPLEKGGESPDRRLAALLGTGGREQLPSNVIPFPGSHRPETTPASVGQRRSTASVFQLKVTLQNIEPPVWRRVLVDAASTLDHVHEVIQAAFGWWNYHLHEFEIDGKSYGVPDPDDDWGTPTIDERRIRLDKIATVDSSISYTYDFGDGWDHRITVEKILTASDARGACMHRRAPSVPTGRLRRPLGLREPARRPRRPHPSRTSGAGRVDRPSLRPRGVRPRRLRPQPARGPPRRPRRLSSPLVDEPARIRLTPSRSRPGVPMHDCAGS